jgi:hypothetical protein
MVARGVLVAREGRALYPKPAHTSNQLKRDQHIECPCAGRDGDQLGGVWVDHTEASVAKECVVAKGVILYDRVGD